MVDFLQGAKNLISGKSVDATPPDFNDNRVERTDQCKVIWYQWSAELSNSDSQFSAGGDSNDLSGLFSQFVNSVDSSLLGRARSYDISNHVENVTYTNSMDGAGSFSITLHNSFDWSRYMKPGQWILVFLSGEGDLKLPKESTSTDTNRLKAIGSKIAFGLDSLGSLNPSPLLAVPELPLPPGPEAKEIDDYKNLLRCMGIISRVGIKSTTTVDGAVEISYAVTGKDYGTIYEETNLWFNANNAEKSAFSNVINSITETFERNLTALLNKWHDIFLAPHLIPGLDPVSDSSFFPVQWILPSKLIEDLNLQLDPRGKGTFGDILNLKEFNSTLFENSDPNPLSGLDGFCWDRLKNLSQPGFHELFTELSDFGNPKIYFRPVPWAFDKSKYPNLGKAMLLYKDLASGKIVNPPYAVNSVITKKITTLAEHAVDELTHSTPEDQRDFHTVTIQAKEVENFDIGPDYHSRYNFFLVDIAKAAQNQNIAYATILAGRPDLKGTYPLRNENDIKRHGFKPMILNVNNFIISNGGLFSEGTFKNDPSNEFIFECNEVMRDFHAPNQDLYSGSITLAGRFDVRLGKVIVTDKSFSGIDDMVFYIEGYTDSFSVNEDGTASWTQTLTVTRGVRKSVLTGDTNVKDRQPIKTETFHAFNKDYGSSKSSTLSTIKKKIINPLG